MSDKEVTTPPLRIDPNLKRWLPVLDAVLREERAVCPVCGSPRLTVDGRKGADRIGYLVVQCQVCGKAGYCSRMRFPESFAVKKF